MERRYMSHHRNSVTNCYATLNFTEIEQSAAKSWPENDF